MKILKSVFFGTAKYTDATKMISETIDTYTSSIVHLGTALNIKLLEETKEIQKSVVDVSKKIDKLSISAEANFQTLHVESQTSSDGINKILQEILGKFSLPYFGFSDVSY